MDNLIETWRGEALAWEADQLGHMNMRYYFDRAFEARAQFAHHLGLPHIYRTSSLSTLLPTKQHIKYIKEVQPGEAIVVNSGVLAIGETDITLFHVINGNDERLSATIVETLSHIAARTGFSFPWSSRTQKRVKSLLVSRPDFAKPHNIDPDEKTGETTMALADTLGLQTIGRGCFRPSECDVLGHVLPTAILGRISDSAQHLSTAWPDLKLNNPDGMSAALLEALVRHKSRPKAGDLFEIRSGLRNVTPHVRELCHWVLDPVRGTCWSTVIGVGCRFNLNTRRLVKVEGDMLAQLQDGVIAGLNP